MLGDFWVPMINRFEGSASSDNQNFSFLDSWPTGRISGGHVNGVVSSFLSVPFSGSARTAERQLFGLRHMHAFYLCRYGLPGRVLLSAVSRT